MSLEENKQFYEWLRSRQQQKTERDNGDYYYDHGGVRYYGDGQFDILNDDIAGPGWDGDPDSL